MYEVHLNNKLLNVAKQSNIEDPEYHVNLG